MNSPLVRFLRIINSAIRRLALTLIAEQLSLTFKTLASIQKVEPILARAGGDAARAVTDDITRIREVLRDTAGLKSLSPQARIDLRNCILRADEGLGQFENTQAAFLSPADKVALEQLRSQMRGVVDFVVTWVIVAVALALGVGTTVGWKRVVITVGEKIGKAHLSYAQGASAELVAMTTIAAADIFGLPVSTTNDVVKGGRRATPLLPYRPPRLD